MNTPPPVPSYYATPQQGMLPARPSTWPKVLGIIGIIFGSVAMVGGMISVLAFKTMSATYESMGLGAGFVEKHLIALKYIPPIAGSLGLLLLLGSILLLVRKRLSRGLLLLWAVLKVALVIGQTPYNTAMTKDMMPFQKQIMDTAFKNAGGVKPAPAATPAPEPAVPAAPSAPPVPTLEINSVVETTMVISQAVAVIWGCVLPVFLLIWLMRGKIRAEVAEWGA